MQIALAALTGRDLTARTFTIIALSTAGLMGKTIAVAATIMGRCLFIHVAHTTIATSSHILDIEGVRDSESQQMCSWALFFLKDSC